MPIFDLQTKEISQPVRLSDGIKAIQSNEAIQPIGADGEALVVNLLDEITRPRMTAEEETESRYTHKKWAPKELNNRHREMMRRILEGASYIDIAAAMGLSVVTVSLVCSSAIFKEELKKLESELNLNVIRRAEDLSHEALDKLKVLMRQARSESLQASCAERVLGIAGYSKIEKKQVSVVSGEDVIRELNRRRREASQLFRRDAGPEAGTDAQRSNSDSSTEVSFSEL